MKIIRMRQRINAKTLDMTNRTRGLSPGFLDQRTKSDSALTGLVAP